MKNTRTHRSWHGEEPDRVMAAGTHMPMDDGSIQQGYLREGITAEARSEQTMRQERQQRYNVYSMLEVDD